MFKRNLIASVILAATIVFTGTATAFAIKGDDNAKNTQNTPNTFIPARIDHEKMHVLIKTALDNLVKDSTITQAQEDAVLKAMAAKRKKVEASGKGKGYTIKKAIPRKAGKCAPHGRKHGVLKDLVKAGTITQEQAEAIKEAIKSAIDSVHKPE